MSDVNSWMDLYVRAWSSNEPDDIRALFTEDAIYNTRPHDTNAWRGHDAIVREWSGDSSDKPEDWTFEWTLLGRDGDTAFVQGVTTYLNGDPTYDNLWVLRFAKDGRVSEFTEWYMARKSG